MPSIDATTYEQNPIIDPTVLTPTTGNARRGTALRISPIVKVNGAIVDSFSNMASITAKVVPLTNLLGVLVTKTEVSLHEAGTGGSGTGAGSVDFDFTTEEMNLNLSGGDGTKATFAIMFSATLLTGEIIPLGQHNLTVYEDPAALSLAALGSNSQNARITTAAKFQLKDPDTGLWHDVFIDGGQIAIGPGGS